MTQRRTLGPVGSAVFMLCCGALAAACSPSKPRDINFGTEAGADFEAPPDSSNTTVTPDAGADADAGTSATDADTDTDTQTPDADTDAGTGSDSD